VIWEFAGEPLTDELRRAAECAVVPPAELATLLEGDEITAISTRARRLLARATFPAEQHSHGYPWPLV
jgi:hypothetical protein